MRHFKKAIAMTMASLMVLSFAGCGGASSETADKGASAGASGSDKADKTISVGFAQVGSESEWRTANTEDMKRAAKESGIDLQFSDAQQKQENQIKAIRSFIASEVDVIALCPIVATGWDTVLQEAKDANIPVILVDRGVTADKSLYVTHIGTDALKEGESAFNWIDQYMADQKKAPRAGDKYNVVILEGTVGSSIAADRLKGFKNAMSAAKDTDKYTILHSQTGEYTRAKGKEVMESFLKSDKDKIDVLFAANDDMALGAIQAIEAAGLKPGKDIVIVSIDAAKGSFNAMVDGKMNCAVEHNPLLGDAVMDAAKKIVAGEKVDANIFVDEGIFPADKAAAELPNRKY